MRTELLHQGVKSSIHLIVEKERSPEFVEFIKEIKRSSPLDNKKIIEYIAKFCEDPERFFKNKEKFRLLEYPIYEMKPTKQIRLYVFEMEVNTWCITHGYIKKVDKNKQSQSEIEKAKQYYNRWYDEYKQ